MALTKVTLTGTVDTLKAGWTKFNDLIDDLLSTDNGLGASCVGVEDSAGNMAATNVEDALAEIYSDTTAAINALTVLDENSATTTGLTGGYKAGSVRFDNTITDVSAGTVSLTDDATNYIQINSSGTVSRNTTGFTSGQIPLRTVVCASGAQTTSTDKRSFFNAWDIPLPVAKGGTGAATLTDHGILLGSGTSAVTPLGVATNGQIPIGSTGADPTLATITGTANQITVTNGAGSITLSIPDTAVLTFGNVGLHLLDTNASHDLVPQCASDLTADRALYFKPGDSAATVMLGDSGATKAWFYQDAAPTGWTIDATPADALLAVKGGANAYNASGGTQQGTWTQTNHTHTTGDFTLTATYIPAHDHGSGGAHEHVLSAWQGPAGMTYDTCLYTFDAIFGTGASNSETWTDATYQKAKSGGAHTHTSVGSGTAHNHGNTGDSATANTWRPLAQLGIICTLN
jgi:hypothetical protein